MTDFEFRRLKKWQAGKKGSKMHLEVPLPQSQSGLVLRWCPNESCAPRRFQLGDAEREEELTKRELMRREPGSTGCTCPYCGEDAEDDDFLAPEDVDAARKKVEWAFREDVVEWMQDLADEFNQRINKGGNNFLGIEMDVPRRPQPEPAPWRADLLRSMCCDLCGRIYGVYAIGFFCPDCGSANLSNHFRREISLIVGQVDIAEDLKEDGARELSYRLLGNAHEDVVTAFETYLKSAFNFVFEKRLSPNEQAELNADLGGSPFQSVNRSRRLYKELGVNVFADLSEDEVKELWRNVEKRHVVGHNLGIADERYTEVASDAEIGETVSLLADDIDRFARLCLRAVERIESDLPELHPS